MTRKNDMLHVVGFAQGADILTSALSPRGYSVRALIGIVILVSVFKVTPGIVLQVL